ncbi:hypothetical protein BDV98DRAFT_583637 [Pterulicium gracile]|uniref:Uncharacterized protein n=1 Tax=Pterulicium gracile TaxID=1884261 RepID=A0A5C3QG09_9AGAR|nr:hypothetical protein BDV98DRAFT_583637 [Pterula gracilis]
MALPRMIKSPTALGQLFKLSEQSGDDDIVQESDILKGEALKKQVQERAEGPNNLQIALRRSVTGVKAEDRIPRNMPQLIMSTMGQIDLSENASSPKWQDHASEANTVAQQLRQSGRTKTVHPNFGKADKHPTLLRGYVRVGVVALASSTLSRVA